MSINASEISSVIAEKLQQQDNIWEKICGSLKWQYIPSI